TANSPTCDVTVDPAFEIAKDQSAFVFERVQVSCPQHLRVSNPKVGGESFGWQCLWRLSTADRQH
ncbi:MAG: hypothetical protein ACRDYY_00460, partial [Acidimicrobiales bacterium]